MRNYRIYFFLILCIFSNLVIAQKKAPFKFIQYPSRFEEPLDYQQSEAIREFINKRDDKNTNKAWYVFGDREGAVSYLKPRGLPTGQKLQFGKLYLVLQEQDDWIEIASYTLGLDKQKLKSNANETYIGWVSKSDVLLWHQALKDPGTGILRKTFLINKEEYYTKHITKVSSIQSGDKDFAIIRDRPGSLGKEVDRSKLYGFYFIFKKEKVGNAQFFLIGKEYRWQNTVVDNEILGWVEEDRCANWDSRLCFEPNFEKESFEFRKANKDFQVRAYNKEADCRAYLNNNEIGNPAYDYDPAKIKEHHIIKHIVNKETRYRLGGQILRYPLLGLRSGGTKESIYFASGVAGEINAITLAESFKGVDDLTYGRFEERVKNLTSNNENFNIIVAVEGISDMIWVREQIRVILDSVSAALPPSASIKFGGVYYRDKDYGAQPILFEPLSNNRNKINSFFESQFFDNGSDLNLTDGTLLNEGIKVALTKVLSSDQNLQNNILIVLGRNADIVQVRGDREGIRSKEIIALINESMVRVLAISDHNKSQHSNLGTEMHSVLNTAANKSYQWYASLHNGNTTFPKLDPPNPILNETDAFGNESLDIKGLEYFKIILPHRSKRILLKENTCKYASGFVLEIQKVREDLSKYLENIFLDGKSAQVSLGGFTAAGLVSMKEVFQNSNLTASDLAIISREKIKMFQYAYIPYKKPKHNKPLLSTILFMPEIELDNYMQILESLIKELKSLNSDKEKAKSLADAMCNLYYTLVGETSTRKTRSCDKVSLAELRRTLHGLDVEGKEADLDDFYFSQSWGINKNATIADISSLDAASLQHINKQLNGVVTYLNSIVRENKFVYESGRNENDSSYKYYWIPIKDAF